MRFGLLVSIALAGLAWPGFVVAQAQMPQAPSSSPLRALVWLQPETDEVLDRIRGQTNDLNVDLLVNTLDPIPNVANAQLQAAYALGERWNASLVIWFVVQPDSERHFIVQIAISKTHRLLTRDLGPTNAGSRSGGLSSAVNESAALVVRAAIQALLSGLTIGEEHAARASALSEPPASSPATPAPSGDTNVGAWRDATEGSSPPSQPPESPNRDTLPWAVGLQWLLSYDSTDAIKMAECALLHGEHRLRSFELLVGVSGCLKRDVDSRYGTVSLGRQQAAIGAEYVLLQTGLQASLGVQTGAIFYERETTGQAAAGVTKQPSSTYAIGSVGPQFRLLVPARGTRVQAGLLIGLDFLTRSLSIGYMVDENFSRTARLSAVQPYAALGLALRF